MSTLPRTIRNLWKVGIKVRRPRARPTEPLLTRRDRTTSTK